MNENDRPEPENIESALPNFCPKFSIYAWFHGVFYYQVQTAVAYGITSKGPWRSAKTPGINQALSLEFLKSEGLYSLRDGWIKLHHS